MEKVDIAIIGAGVVGLATSYALSESPKDVLVIEKHPSFGQETSSRNSEVIHAGLYYKKDSLKAKTCIRGKKLLYSLCEEENIPYKKLGKLVIAPTKDGVPKIENVLKNAEECGVNNLKPLNKNDIKKLEPSVEAEGGFFSPDTGIIDSHSLMDFFYQKSKARGVNFAFSVEVTGIEKEKDYYKIVVKEPKGEEFSFEAKNVINSAGLFSDKVSGFLGIDPKKYGYEIHYCKGQYFRISHPGKFSINHLIYPPPTDIDLGIHLTRDLGGGLRLGPDAKYVGDIDYMINEKDKDTFFDSVSKFLPSLTKDELTPDTVGVRPKLQRPDEDFRDFVIKDETDKGFPGFINLIGIESPGLTSSLSIAEIVKNIVDKY